MFRVRFNLGPSCPAGRHAQDVMSRHAHRHIKEVLLVQARKCSSHPGFGPSHRMRGVSRQTWCIDTCTLAAAWVWLKRASGDVPACIKRFLVGATW